MYGRWIGGVMLVTDVGEANYCKLLHIASRWDDGW
jgi:hypothetical protein